MHKTTTINLSGQLFTINEDAYELLEAYLGRLRAKLEPDEDREEIMHDFEQAVAEHLLDQLPAEQPAVSKAMVRQVIEAIGEYESSEAEEAIPKTDAQLHSTQQSWYHHFKHPIYLDKDNAIISGVCAGIARSLEIDPFWVRLAFVIIIFGSWGVAILAYIVLMLIMKDPQNMTEQLRAEGIRPTAAALVAHSKQRFQQAQKNLAQVDVNRRMRPLTTLIKSVIRLVVASFSTLSIAVVTIAYVVLAGFWFSHHVSTNQPFNYVSSPLMYTLLVSSYFVIVLPLIILLLVTVSRRIARTALTARSVLLLLMPWLIAVAVFIAAAVLTVPHLADWSRNHPNDPYFQLQINNRHLDNFCVSLGGYCNDPAAGEPLVCNTADTPDWETQSKLCMVLPQPPIPAINN